MCDFNIDQILFDMVEQSYVPAIFCTVSRFPSALASKVRL